VDKDVLTFIPIVVFPNHTVETVMSSMLSPSNDYTTKR